MNNWWDLIDKIPVNSSGLPVLMYHKLRIGQSDKLTVNWDDFRRQMDFLRSVQYRFLSFKDLEHIQLQKKIDDFPQLMLTFDDGDEQTLELLLPYLKENHLKIVSFLPVFYLGKTNSWDGGFEKVVSLEAVKEFSGPEIEWALHSFKHENYELLGSVQIKKDLVNCFIELETHQIPFYKALAYPYGKFPQKKNLKNEMIEVFHDLGIKFAFKIGNRKNKKIWANPYLIERLDIQGQRSFTYFKAQLKWGKIKF